ncbi:MAG TPA: acyl-CoA dehydrogenase family protein [Mycobacteriales bacterium]|nr:acyl-CoA dehydrogenase family protein [Mycobacteriales bacterium]
MDFTLDETQQELVGLARQILAKESTQDRLDALDASGTWLDTALWAQLAEAGVVGAALPEDVGGGGLGFAAAALVCEQVGAHVAQVPFLETVLTALAVDEHGTPQQRQAYLPGVTAGKTLLTAALTETGREAPTDLATTAVVDGDAYRVTGLKTSVPFADVAHRVLVPAVTVAGIVLLLVDPTGPGVRLTAGTGTHGAPLLELELDDAPGELLAEGEEALGGLVDRVLTALAATGLGVSSTALRLSASYTTTREQFGRPVATFQAVGHRLADAYIDVEAIRLTTLHAVWLLDIGLPGRDEARIAKWWASEGGHRVAHAAQHVHGGVGVDTDYVLHRYFTWNKHVEFSLGSAQRQLLSLGASLAAEPV